MERATQALLQADLVLAEQVIGDHEQITAASARAEEAAFVLLGPYRPWWPAICAIVSSIQIVPMSSGWALWHCMSPRSPAAATPNMPFPREVGYFLPNGPCRSRSRRQRPRCPDLAGSDWRAASGRMTMRWTICTGTCSA